MRRSAVIDVSEELLVQALGLPLGTKLIAARVRPGIKLVSLEVEHYSLPEVEAGDASPSALLLLTRIESRFEVQSTANQQKVNPNLGVEA